MPTHDFRSRPIQTDSHANWRLLFHRPIHIHKTISNTQSVTAFFMSSHTNQYKNQRPHIKLEISTLTYTKQEPLGEAGIIQICSLLISGLMLHFYLTFLLRLRPCTEALLRSSPNLALDYVTTWHCFNKGGRWVSFPKIYFITDGEETSQSHLFVLISKGIKQPEMESFRGVCILDSSFTCLTLKLSMYKSTRLSWLPVRICGQHTDV